MQETPPIQRHVLDYPDAELVFGLVCSVGTNRDRVLTAIEDHLKKFNYQTEQIRLSKLLLTLDLGIEISEGDEYQRIKTRMDAGNTARKMTKRDDFLAIAAVSRINQERPWNRETRSREPKPRTAYILDSLKRPEEVTLLRRIYGTGFSLVGVFAGKTSRLEYLTRDKNIEPTLAQELLERDAEERIEGGQRTRDTFHLADVFVSIEEQDYKENVWRFIDLLFGVPFQTPTRDEHFMYLAYAASLRSGDLSRQVGATIESSRGDLIAAGCNDVPAPGGGQYWPGPDDRRDHYLKSDSNHVRRNKIIADVVKQLKPGLSSDDDIALEVAALKGSPIFDITEYGRAVHAEMEALLSCSRVGVSPRDGALYTTTFPCHNCTRHIIAAGLNRVVYIEPYPKSQASELHADAVEIKGETATDPRSKMVTFEPFVGVGPRRYLDLFSMRLGAGYPVEREKNGKAVEWFTGRTVPPRLPMLPTSYLDREKLALSQIEHSMRKLKRR